MDVRASLRRSITVSVAVYFAAQVVVYTAALAIGDAVDLAGYGFYPVAGGFHVLLLVFLHWRMGDLRRTADGALLARVNLPCHLTLLRLSSTPTVVFLSALRGPPRVGVVLLAVVALVFATDFWDGRIARARGETTVMGSYLDSSSDYVILGAVAGAFTAMGIIPVWYAAVLLARLGIHASGMGVLSLVRGRIDPETTFLGKAGVFAAMVVAAFQLARWYAIPVLGDAVVVTSVQIAGAVILLVSLGEKLVYLARKLREPRVGPPP